MVDISQYLYNGKFIASEKLKDQLWLQKIADIDNIICCSKYHSDNTPNISLKGINAVLPIIPKPVHTLSTQYNCMEIIKYCLLKSRPDPNGCIGSTCLCPDKRNSIEISREIWFRFIFLSFWWVAFRTMYANYTF